jgi:iron complex outermembrane recepter protein
LERYNAMALARYELSDGIELYGRANYSHLSVTQTLAPTATAGFTFNIDPTNPFLTADERAVFFGPDAFINDGSTVGDDPTARAGTSTIGIRRRIIETGGRVEINKTRNMQFVGGLRGDAGESMHWDVFAQYGQSKKSRDFLNDLSYTALIDALDIVSGPNGPQCASATARAAGCVPLNLFTTGTIPQDQLAYVLRNGREDTKITQFIVGGSLSGDLNFLKSPWADKPAAFSIGAEYRREKGDTVVDANYGSGDLIYYGQGQNISGKYNVKEIFAELKVPIVQDKPFLYALNLEGGFRYSDYSTVGSVYTYKAGGDWSPSEGFRLRGIYQRAVRAPNLYELYSPVVAGTGSLDSDPCAAVFRSRSPARSTSLPAAIPICRKKSPILIRSASSSIRRA